jgi:hypothetical protein
MGEKASHTHTTGAGRGPSYWQPIQPFAFQKRMRGLYLASVTPMGLGRWGDRVEKMPTRRCSMGGRILAGKVCDVSPHDGLQGTQAVRWAEGGGARRMDM